MDRPPLEEAFSSHRVMAARTPGDASSCAPSNEFLVDRLLDMLDNKKVAGSRGKGMLISIFLPFQNDRNEVPH